MWSRSRQGTSHVTGRPASVACASCTRDDLVPIGRGAVVVAVFDEFGPELVEGDADLEQFSLQVGQGLVSRQPGGAGMQVARALPDLASNPRDSGPRAGNSPPPKAIQPPAPTRLLHISLDQHPARPSLKAFYECNALREAPQPSRPRSRPTPRDSAVGAAARRPSPVKRGTVRRHRPLDTALRFPTGRPRDPGQSEPWPRSIPATVSSRSPRTPVGTATTRRAKGLRRSQPLLFVRCNTTVAPTERRTPSPPRRIGLFSDVASSHITGERNGVLCPRFRAGRGGRHPRNRGFQRPNSEMAGRRPDHDRPCRHHLPRRPSSTREGVLENADPAAGRDGPDGSGCGN